MSDDDKRFLADEQRIRDLEKQISEARHVEGLAALALCEIARQLVQLNRRMTETQRGETSVERIAREAP